MNDRYVCARCSCTFPQSRIKETPQGISVCPVCGSTVFYDVISPNGMKLRDDVFHYELQGRQIRRDFEEDISALYAAGVRSWDDVLQHFKDRFVVDELESVPYVVGVNSSACLRLTLKVMGWRVTLAINSENRVYVYGMYRKNDICKI